MKIAVMTSGEDKKATSSRFALPRFSLRSLFVGSIVIGLALGWGFREHQLSKEILELKRHTVQRYPISNDVRRALRSELRQLLDMMERGMLYGRRKSELSETLRIADDVRPRTDATTFVFSLGQYSNDGGVIVVVIDNLSDRVVDYYTAVEID